MQEIATVDQKKELTGSLRLFIQEIKWGRNDSGYCFGGNHQRDVTVRFGWTLILK